jgi:hypothetical protein
VDPWGEERADLRSGVNALLVNGKFNEVEILYPHVSTDTDDISVEDEAEIIAIIRRERQAQSEPQQHATVGTTESETDRVG